MEWKKNVEETIQELRPILQNDGGDVELVEVTDDGIVKVRLQGACAHCHGAIMTLKQGIEARLKAKVPEVKEVQRVED